MGDAHSRRRHRRGLSHGGIRVRCCGLVDRGHATRRGNSRNGKPVVLGLVPELAEEQGGAQVPVPELGREPVRALEPEQVGLEVQAVLVAGMGLESSLPAWPSGRQRQRDRWRRRRRR